MLTFFPIALAFFLFIYEYRNYKMLKKAKFLYEKDGVKFYKIDGNEDNAITIKSILFGKNVIIVGRMREEILAHEEGHLRQPNFMFYFSIIAALVISCNVLLTPLLLIVYKIMFLHYERDADLYAFHKYNVRYVSDARRPEGRIERLKLWLFDTHPPDYVRRSEEYYDKKTNILILFLRDLML